MKHFGRYVGGLLFALSVMAGGASASLGAACYAQWSSTTAYTAGQTASYNSVNYVANWWTQGQNPSTNNGGSGSGEPWTSQGACSSGSCSANPSAPTGLSASGTTSSSTSLSWSAVTPPTNCTVSSYTVYKNGTSLGTASGTSFSVTGLSASTTYTFAVAATDSNGTGSQSSTITVTTSSASCSATPSAPSGLSASGTTSSSTSLSWSAVTAPANCSISSYTVYKSGTSVGTTSSTSFSVTGLSASTTYTFTVAASDSDGTGSQSSGLSVTTSSASCSATPSAPSGLAASGTTSSGTSLSWSAVTPPANCSISSYSVYQNGSSIGTSSSASFSVSGLAASTTYTFTVAATDSDGTGSQSSSITVTTSSSGGGSCSGIAAWSSAGVNYAVGALVTYEGNEYKCDIANTSQVGWDPVSAPALWVLVQACSTACTTSPSAPTGLGSSNTTNTSTVISWSAVTAPSGCSISSYTVTKNGSSLGTTTATSFTATGLSASTTYTFGVAATDGNGTGTATTISVTTASGSCSATPSAPSGLASSNTSSSGTTLTWNSVTPPTNCAVTSYTVYKNGTALATTASTSYNVAGLSASTTYTFTVATSDSFGTGGQSSSITVTTSAQSTAKGKMIGYWETWGSLTLLNAATDYDVIALAFTTSSGTDGATQAFPATTESTSQIMSDIATLHSQGKKVLISVGGASTYTIQCDNSADVSSFVSSVESIVNTYNLDGLDLDIENNNLALNAGDTNINSPTTPSTVYMIQAIADLKANYGSNFMITMAPQVADINCAGHPLGNDGAGLYWGSFIPLINVARNNITYVDTQDYNASAMYEKNGTTVVNQGTPDFDVAMSDLLLSGYTIYGTGQAFPALNPNQVVVGTPAVTAAAGSGYNTPAAIDEVINYIKFGTSYGGSYTLSTTYPNFGGVMTWDCDYDYNAGDPMASAVMAAVHQ